MASNAEIARLLLFHGAKEDALDDKGMTPLHICAMNGRSDMAKLLVEKDQFVYLPDPTFKLTPLHICALFGQTDVAKELVVKRGVNLDALDYNKNSPLHLSAYYGHLEMTRLLLEHGANLKTRNNGTHSYGDCPKGYITKIKPPLLREQFERYTPYQFASMTEHDDIKKLMEEYGHGGHTLQRNRNSFRMAPANTYK